MVWDFDGTLAHRPAGWRGAVLEAVRAAGVVCNASLENVGPFLQSGFPWHQPDVIREIRGDPDEWWAALEPVFERAIRSLTQADAGTAALVARRVRDAYTSPTSWSLYGDTRPVLDALSRAGWVQLVLSNHVPELSAICTTLGLSPYFARIFNSAETGVEKPHPRAFRQVLDVVPYGSPVWMVGDSLQADVLAAEAAGIKAILVRSVHPQAERCCLSLTDALAMLTAPDAVILPAAPPPD